MSLTTIHDEPTFNTKLTGFKYLKHLDIDNLIPIQNISNRQSSKIMSTPIFYHVKTEKFSFTLPDSFFDNINIKEILKNYINIPQSIVIKDNNKTNIAFLFNNLSEIKNFSLHASSSYLKFKKRYSDYLLNLENGQEVIFMAFKTKNSQLFEDHIPQSLKDALSNQTIGVTTQFEFCRAYKFNHRYYMVQPNGEINKERFFEIEPDSKHDMDFLVFPFTQDDWILAHQIHNKIKSIKEELSSFFQMQKSPDALDKPISNISTKMKFLK